MRIHHARMSVKTGGPISVENITPQVQAELHRAGVGEGIVVVSVPHTTCGVVLNEDENGLKDDMKRLAARLLAPMADERGFSHDCVDNNAQAHLTSILMGHSVTLPVVAGALELGTWQSVFLIEMDGPRARSVRVQVLGE